MDAELTDKRIELVIIHFLVIEQERKLNVLLDGQYGYEVIKLVDQSDLSAAEDRKFFI